MATVLIGSLVVLLSIAFPSLWIEGAWPTAGLMIVASIVI